MKQHRLDTEPSARLLIAYEVELNDDTEGDRFL